MHLAAITMNVTLLSSILAAPISQVAPRFQEQNVHTLDEQRLVPRYARELESTLEALQQAARAARQDPVFRPAEARELEMMPNLRADAVLNTTPRNGQELHQPPRPFPELYHPMPRGPAPEPRPIKHFHAKVATVMLGTPFVLAGIVLTGITCGVGMCSGKWQRKQKLRRQREEEEENAKKAGKKV